MSSPSSTPDGGAPPRPGGIPHLPFAQAQAAGVQQALDLHGAAVLRACATPAHLARVAARAAALPDEAGAEAIGLALIDALPAPAAFQLLQHLLGEDYVLAEGRLVPRAGPPAGAGAAEGGIVAWLPLDGGDLSPGDLLLCRRGGAGGTLPPGPAIVLRFTPRPPVPPAVAADLARSVALSLDAYRSLAAGSGSPGAMPAPAAASDVLLAFARLMRDYRPVDVLPGLRGSLEEAGLLPPGAARWAMPELEPPPVPAPALAAPAGRGFGLCMSVRNHAGLVARALAGLAAQGRAFDRIVLVDDASDDATLDRLQAFAAGRGEVEVLRNAERLGGVASIGRAVARLDTDYLAWAAADDLLLPQALARLAAAAAAQPQAALVLGETGVVPLADGRFGAVGSMAHGGAMLGSLAPWLAPEQLPGILSCRRLSFGTAWIMRRDALAAIGGFAPALGPLADFFAGLALACRHGIAVVPERLSVMSVDAASYSRSTGGDPRAMAEIRDAFLDRLKSPPFRDVYARFAATPALIMDLQSGAEMFTTYFVHRPQHWDLMLRALWWALRHGEMSIGRRA